jgi:hypothetical protein
MKSPAEVGIAIKSSRWVDCNVLVLPDRSIEADLKAFGLDNIDSKLVNQHDNEWYRFSTEFRLSDVKVNVHHLENHHKKLTEDILQSQKSIKALQE